jgi:hypothetical protein
VSVFTIYCHGSGGHRDKTDKEIVCYLGRRATGQEYQDYLILDGVGGEPITTRAQNPMAGTFNWADRNKGSNVGVPKELGGAGRTRRLMQVLETSPMIANASGFGVENNARHAIATIANLPTLPTTINMIGWSRGAVTAMMIAYMLYGGRKEDPSLTEGQKGGLFPGIPVNIFAFDPVAGRDAGIGDETRSTLKKNVKNFLCLLAVSENRSTFRPQDLSRVAVDAETNAMFLPMPGKHSTAPQCNDGQADEVSEVSWSLAVQFLMNFGTTITNPGLSMSRAEYLERYSSMHMRRGQLAEIRHKYHRLTPIENIKLFIAAEGKLETRSFTQQMSEYVRNGDYFINEHHRAVFDMEMPHLSEWLFKPGVATGQHAVQEELKAKKRHLPGFFASLPGLSVIEDGDGRFQLPQKGSRCDPQALHDIQARGSLSKMGVRV